MALRALRSAVLTSAVFLVGCAGLDPHVLMFREARTAHPVQAMSPALRAQAYEVVRRTVAERYYDPNMHGVDWHAATEPYLQKVLQAESEQEAWVTLDHMTGLLQDGHTRVESPLEAQQRSQLQALGFGFSVRAVAQHIFVDRIRADSPAYAAGVRAGMQLCHMEGGDAWQRYLDTLRKIRPSSSAQATALMASRRMMEVPEGQLTRLSFAGPPPAACDGAAASQVSLSSQRFGGGKRVEGLTLSSGLGYLRLSDFNDDVLPDLQLALRSLPRNSGWILDLRGNGGGAMSQVRHIANEVFAQPKVLGHIQTRSGQALGILFNLLTLVESEQKVKGRGEQAFSGPMVVLVDRESASASEMLAGALQASGRARIIGETTCGCLLGFAGYFGLPGGGRLAVSEVGIQLADGQRVEGRGVLPDVPVPWNAQDWIQGRDRALEAAQAELLHRLSLPKEALGKES